MSNTLTAKSWSDFCSRVQHREQRLVAELQNIWTETAAVLRSAAFAETDFDAPGPAALASLDNLFEGPGCRLAIDLVRDLRRLRS